MIQTPVPQQEKGVLTYPAHGWRKALFKWPVHLWRLGAAPLLGQVIMLITHTGRKSGLPRRTLVEYHTLHGRKYVPCAFGRKAQWYRNIEADPHVTIQTAHGTEPMTAVRVTDDAELLAVINHIRRRNGFMVDRYLDSLAVDSTPEDILAKKDRLYFLRFDPTTAPTPPPLAVDLWWIGPLTAVFLLTLWWLIHHK